MIVITNIICCVTGYGITVIVSKSNYKIRYHFMGSSLIFQFLYINVLNYRYFHTDSSTFFFKQRKNAFYRKIKQESPAGARVTRDSAVIPRWPSAAILDNIIIEPEIAPFDPQTPKTLA